MPSFDIVSKTDLAEVGNAIDGVTREISTRFDFKGSASKIERQDGTLTLTAEDGTKLRQMQDLVKGYFVRRKLDPRCIEWKDEEKGKRLAHVLSFGSENNMGIQCVFSVARRNGFNNPLIGSDYLCATGDLPCPTCLTI